MREGARRAVPRSRSAVVAAVAASIAGVGAQQPPRFGERVEVARLIVDARVLDDRGNPIAGLTADDFKVSIDGKVARVETATWVGGHDTVVDPEMSRSASSGTADRAAGIGRLIGFPFPKDLQPSRIVGLLGVPPHSQRPLETLTPPGVRAILRFA